MYPQILLTRPFYLYSDDGSKLYMDGTTIVDNDGSHSVKWESGTTATTVKKGLHSLKIEYFQGPTGHDFNIHYSHAQIPRCQLPLEKLYCPGSEVDGRKKFYSEQNPYIKIEAIDKNEDEKIEGWVITNTDGSKMCYGNLDFSDTRDATRFTFCSGQYVGNVTSGVPELYPFQWDLSEIRDIIGNPIVYKYQQDLEAVHSGEYNSDALASPLYYTKASYLKEIKSPDGKKVTFTLEDKGDEKYDAYAFSSEPDGFLEFKESKRIKQIDSYNANATEPLVHYEFTYDYLNNTYSNLYKKSLLKSIKEYRGGTTVSDLYNTTILDYYDDIQRAERFDDSYNYGALKTILTNAGLLSKFEYSKVTGTDNSTLNYDYSLNGANECPLIHGREGLVLHSGTYDEGKEFIIVQGGHKFDRLWLHTFNGNKWNYDNTFECQLYGNTGKKDVYVFDNTIVYKTSGHNQDVIKVLFWANEKWCVNDLTISGDGTGIDVVSVGNDFMVLRGGDGGDNKDRIWVYRRFNDCWVLDFKYDNYNFGIGGTKSIAVGKDYFVVKQDGASNNAWIVQWDGKKWNEHKIIYEGIDDKTFTDVYAGADYVVFIGSDGTESRRDHIWIYYWNGTSWKYDNEFKSYFLYNTEDKAVFVGNGFFVVQKAAGTQNQVWVFTWNGENWDKKQLQALSGPDWYHKTIVGPDYFILQGGSGSSNASIRLYKKTEDDWVVEPRFNWTGIDFDGNCVDIAIATTWNAFAVITTNNNILSNIYSRVYTFDGTTWNNAFENSYEKTGSKNPSLCVTRNGFGFATNANNNHLQFIHKFRNNYSNPESYVVTKTSNGSLPFSQETSTTSSTTYRYKNGVFDANYGIIKFNEVESINEQTGKIVNYYFNDSEADNQQQQNSEYKELDGFNYRKTVFRKAGIDTDDPPISKEEYSYKIEKKDHWPTNLKSKRLFETKSIVNSITKSSFLYYNESNGLPSEIVTRNPDGSATMTRTRFAFEYYNDMGINNKHMLSQPCQKITYGRLENQSYKPLSSSAATFKQDPKTNCWLQDNNYWLNLAMDNNGFPEASGNYSNFNFGDVNQNSNWKFVGGNIKYDKYGSIIQTTSADGINNSVNRRNDNKMTIAKIANATYEECAVFTCDYDDKVDPDYFDKENGWGKGAGNDIGLPNAESIVCEEAKHFGNKGVKVTNAFGPTRAFKLEKGRDYIYSAWIKKVSGDVPLENGMVIGIDYRKRKSSEGVWPYKLYLLLNLTQFSHENLTINSFRYQ
ncbi:MAG: hypothetical protein GX639_05635 [Fibrobacter sp.]|nr:hypothetical protein [Fibrobacter sp.]